jgi:hypothetical protein
VFFRVIEINPHEHSVIVRYFSDKLSEDDLATSVVYEDGNKIIQRGEDGNPLRCRTDTNFNIWQTPSPNEEELTKIFNDAAPVDWFKIQHDVLDINVDTSLGSAKSMKNKNIKVNKPEKQQFPVPDNKVLTEKEIADLIDNLTK